MRHEAIIVNLPLAALALAIAKLVVYHHDAFDHTLTDPYKSWIWYTCTVESSNYAPLHATVRQNWGIKGLIHSIGPLLRETITDQRMPHGH